MSSSRACAAVHPTQVCANHASVQTISAHILATLAGPWKRWTCKKLMQSMWHVHSQHQNAGLQVRQVSLMYGTAHVREQRRSPMLRLNAEPDWILP